MALLDLSLTFYRSNSVLKKAMHETERKEVRKEVRLGDTLMNFLTSEGVWTGSAFFFFFFGHSSFIEPRFHLKGMNGNCPRH